jgi:hypothetical protein
MFLSRAWLGKIIILGTKGAEKRRLSYLSDASPGEDATPASLHLNRGRTPPRTPPLLLRLALRQLQDLAREVRPPRSLDHARRRDLPQPLQRRESFRVKHYLLLVFFFFGRSVVVLRENGTFFECFPMFVPSLSW